MTLPVLTFWQWLGQNALSILNLLAFLGSVIVLWKTKEAAERQTERTSKPVISLSRQNWELSEEELLEPEFHATVLDPFRLRNVGNGTALVVHWRFKTAELAAKLGWLINTIAPRVNELRKMDLVLDAGKRTCKITGSTAHVWRAKYPVLPPAFPEKIKAEVANPNTLF